MGASHLLSLLAAARQVGERSKLSHVLRNVLCGDGGYDDGTGGDEAIDVLMFMGVWVLCWRWCSAG